MGVPGPGTGLIASSKPTAPFSLRQFESKSKEAWKCKPTNRGRHLPHVDKLVPREYSGKCLSALHITIPDGVEGIHKSAIELVKNNVLFFNIFIDRLKNKIQVLINTLVQEKLRSNNSKRMIQVAVIH